MNPKVIVREGYDRVSRAYHGGDRPAFGVPYDEWIADLINVVPTGAAVLDLGCGVGLPVAAALAKRCKVTGVDISPVQIERARALVPDAQFMCSDMAQVDFDTESIFAVIALYSLIHLPLEEQPRMFERIARWLVAGGWFVATLGHEAWTGTENDWLDVEGAVMYWSHTDAESYRRWLVEAGLSIVDDRIVDDGAGGRHWFVRARRAA